MKLPDELIEDYKCNVAIKDLCCKYGLSHGTIGNQLAEMGLREKSTWGGRRKGGGRKKKENDEKRGKKIISTGEGVRAYPRFKLW